jgi:hypothetical protein
MDLFAGLTKTDYQDILRAIGFFADSKGFANIRVVETDEGLVFQGVTKKDGIPQLETYLLTTDDLKAMLNEAYQRRNAPRAPGSP